MLLELIAFQIKASKNHLKEMQKLVFKKETRGMELTNADLYDHYAFYIDNCTSNEVPLSFKEYKREYGADLIELFNNDKEKLNDWIKGQLGFGS